MPIHFLPIFDCQFLYERLAPLLRHRRRRKLLAPPPAGCHGALARQPDSTAASRIGDGGAAEGSSHNHDSQLGKIYIMMLNELNCTFGVIFSRFHC